MFITIANRTFDMKSALITEVNDTRFDDRFRVEVEDYMFYVTGEDAKAVREFIREESIDLLEWAEVDRWRRLIEEATKLRRRLKRANRVDDEQLVRLVAKAERRIERRREKAETLFPDHFEQPPF